MFGRKIRGFMAKKATVVNQPSEIDALTPKPNEVLSGNGIHIAELAVRSMKSDEVSEFDGKSAEVLEGDTSEESDDDKVARRVDAVVAAAEEIRKNKNAGNSTPMSPRRKNEKETQASAEGRDEEDVVKRAKQGDNKEEEEESPIRVGSTKSQCIKNDVHTSDEETFTLSTVGSSATHTHCTEDSSIMHAGGGTRTVITINKKEPLNKDVIIHAPGGPENLVVRKMYYAPEPKDPEDVIIEVEVSKLLMSYYSCGLITIFHFFTHPSFFHVTH
jgi:hypothetical protein